MVKFFLCYAVTAIGQDRKADKTFFGRSCHTSDSSSRDFSRGQQSLYGLIISMSRAPAKHPPRLRIIPTFKNSPGHEVVQSTKCPSCGYVCASPMLPTLTRPSTPASDIFSDGTLTLPPIPNDLPFSAMSVSCPSDAREMRQGRRHTEPRNHSR